MSLKLLTICVLVLGCYAAVRKQAAPAPDWNGLKVTFGLNPWSSFMHLPRSVPEAESLGWTRDSSIACNGTFNGIRYMKDNDMAAMVLFDVNGYIAGLQAGIPKSEEYPRAQNRKYHVFLEEENMWVITAYFTDPSKICTEGRSAAQVEREGTGTMLSIQNGPTADSQMVIPLEESEVVPTTPFVQGKCVYWMGMHYWYNLSSTMSCDDTFPVFPMYNNNKLNAFGWAFNPNYQNSPRWEHPVASVFGLFMHSPPPCLGADGPVTTLHVYLTDSPRLNFC